MPRSIVFLKSQEDPSSYYRLYQYLRGSDCRVAECLTLRTYRWYYGSDRSPVHKRIIMAAENLLRVTFFCIYDKLIWRSEIVIINRKLFPRKMPFYGGLLLEWYIKGKKIFWDFDDNIIADGEITKREVRLLEENSEKIIVTNSYLKKTITGNCHSKVVVLPTTDADLRDYEYRTVEDERLRSYQREIRLIWVGTKNNVIYLEEIFPLLDECAALLKKEGKSLSLTVVSNRTVNIRPKDIKVDNIRWTRAEALNQLRMSHIGLMPLHDDEYTRGKGGFKAIQYLGMGIPAVVSAVGFNLNVIDDGENGFVCNSEERWKKSILMLCETPERWLEFSRKARNKWQTSFNSDKQYEFWMDIVKP